MKKTYKYPEIAVVVLKPMQLLAGSEYIPVKDDNYGDGGDITLGARESDSDWGDE
jgi:hypothetical protein